MAKKNKSLDIKDLQDNLTGKAREVWLAGLGALASVEDEGVKLYESLKTKGEDFEKRGKKQIESAMDSLSKETKDRTDAVTTKVTETVEGTVKDVMSRFDIPTRDEIQSLIKKVDNLTKKVDSLAKESNSTGTKTSKSTATKKSS